MKRITLRSKKKYISKMGFLSWLSDNKVQTNRESFDVTGTNISIYKSDKHTQLVEEIKIGVEILLICIIILIIFFLLRKYLKSKKQKRQQQQNRDLQLSILGLDNIETINKKRRAVQHI